MKLTSPLFVLLLATPAVCQSNMVPGTDINIYDVGSPNVYGRVGPAYPNGTAGVVIGHSHANCGTVNVPWIGNSGGVMVQTYPKIAFLLARESNGRMVQISGKSFMKHSRVAFNFSGGGPCAPCQSGPSNTFRVGCYDIYSAGFNGSQSNLGPTTEVNPWLGTWNPVGSYFDIGDPGQSGYPLPADGVQSLSTSGFGSVKNRMEVPEQELVQAGTFYGQNHVVVIGEPIANRANNLVSRPLSFGWNGSSWSVSLQGTSLQGSVLERWIGATNSLGGNGNDDGRFMVAVRVTGPVGGMWHYEYAVHNIDNDRGGASLRIPICPDARVENVGFRDIDQDFLNEWAISQSGGELSFLAGANNPLDWNTLYNFWFDSDAAPIVGNVSIDEARPGPGALAVSVAARVPGLLGTAYLGDGCGAPAPRIAANGVPQSPNPGYGIDVEVAPVSFVLVAFADQPANIPVGNGCDVLIDNTQLLVSELLQANASGTASYGVAIPPGLMPTDVAVQAFEFLPGGPLFGFAAASNGLLIRAAGSGCP